MEQGIKYTREYRVDCNKISIDLLKALNDFLNEQNLLSQNERQRVRFKCDNLELSETFFANILNNKKFISNIDKNFSIVIIVLNEDLSDFFNLYLERENNEIKISGCIRDTNEHIVVGYKKVLEKFLKDNFLEEKVFEQEINENSKQIDNMNNTEDKNINSKENETVNITLEKKILDWDIPSVKLTLDDLTEIEFILKQDLTDIKEYKINVEPNKKYLQKHINVPKYTFNSSKEFSTHEDLLKNIKNYSIQFELRTDEIYVYFRFSNENIFLNTLYTKGENQTLYYGKYKLLTDYLNTKKNWYAIIYDFNFPVIKSIVLSLLVCLWTFGAGMYIEEKSWLNLVLSLLCMISVISLLIFTPKILIKYNFKLQKNNKFWESSNFQFCTFVILNLIMIVLAIIPIMK